MVTKKKDAFHVPSPLIKVIQQLVALVVYDKLVASSTMKLTSQDKFCYKEYHGGNESDENDTIGQGMLFLQGRLHFADAFDKETIDITEANGQTNKQRTLKKLLTQDACLVYQVGTHLTRDDLVCNVSKTKADPITGWQIIHIAGIAKKNILKATAIADAYTQHMQEGGP